MTTSSAAPWGELDERNRAEARRAAECAAEPIRTIGRIQSYGFLLGMDDVTGTVTVASENAAHWLGRDLRASGGAMLAWALAESVAVDPVRAEVDGTSYDVIVHRGTDPLLVEFEPVMPELEYVRTGVVGAIQRLASVADPDELRQTAAREIKRITGYDRVMCYQFHADGHGQVVADEREPDMESYFGLHFPASDIPSQARALYLEKRSRMIADTEDPGCAVETITERATALDLGGTELRAASVHHLEFMRNMGQVSTVSFALVHDGNLIGMFTCAHRSRRRLPVLLRRALEVLATHVSSRLTAAQEIASLRHQLAARERRASVIAPLYGRDDVGTVLMSGERTVLDAIPADGAVLRLRGEVRSVGLTPNPEALSSLIDALPAGLLISESLSAEHPEASALAPGVAGILVVPLGGDGDCLVFVRGEVARAVDWLGDQRPVNRNAVLSPRRSFSAWREEVRGQSAPWGELESDAFELGADVRAALTARTQAELAELAWRDALTGLHNRRYLDERLDGLFSNGPTELALVFIDLDSFKSVNDTYGHEAGDEVLTAVGKRLASCARSSDIVTRFGGDEFVIACIGASVDEVAAIANRAVDALSKPIATDSAVVQVGGSAGIVIAEAGTTAADLLGAADAAMYRAKRDGGGRVSA